MAPWPPPAGYGPAAPYPGAPSSSPNPLCLASTILGVAAVVLGFCCFFLGVPLGLAALVTGIMGLGQVRTSPGGSDKALAILGICGGAASLLLLLGMVVFFTVPFVVP